MQDSSVYSAIEVDLTLFVLQSAVMEEVNKQLSELSAKQKEKVEELNSEIRKLKAMIVKHETRIR